MSRRTRRSARPTHPFHGVEALEERRLMAISDVTFDGSTLVVRTDNLATNVEVLQAGSTISVRDLSGSRTWDYAARSVAGIRFQGGAGNDRFVSRVTNVPVQAFGSGGQDHLQGSNAADSLEGGEGNDVILGGPGNDRLVGGDGDDQLNGQAGDDELSGGGGNDVLVSIDATTGDGLTGGEGVDVFWIDAASPSGGTPSPADSVVDASRDDTLQRVNGFANGADCTLDGDVITGPALPATRERFTNGVKADVPIGYQSFGGRPLFATGGPRLEDVQQQQLGDCYLLAGLGAIAQDSSLTIRHNVVDFNDGTYGVRLGASFYRVDNQLPVFQNGTAPVFAALGRQQSMWVPIVEKAFAHYRTPHQSYVGIEGGACVEPLRAFGFARATLRTFASYGNATAMANDMFDRWCRHQALTVGFDGDKKKESASGDPIVTGHAYTLVEVKRDATCTVTQIVLRNPWGSDGAGSSDADPNDGLVTLTPEQVFRNAGDLSCIDVNHGHGRQPSSDGVFNRVGGDLATFAKTLIKLGKHWSDIADEVWNRCGGNLPKVAGVVRGAGAGWTTLGTEILRLSRGNEVAMVKALMSGAGADWGTAAGEMFRLSNGNLTKVAEVTRAVGAAWETVATVTLRWAGGDYRKMGEAMMNGASADVNTIARQVDRLTGGSMSTVANVLSDLGADARAVIRNVWGAAVANALPITIGLPKWKW